MAREESIDEEVIWEGRAARVEVPGALRAARVALFLVSGTCTCFAVVTGLGLGLSPLPLLLCAAWTTTLGLLVRPALDWWLGAVTYIITDNHVVWKRGKLSRIIARDQISYSRIFWSAEDPNVGDIELVRAVPTGVLRRRLLIRLRGLAAPDRVWALVRGMGTRSDSNAGTRCVSQRLEEGERVIWSARPAATWRRFLPHGVRRFRLLAVALALALTSVKLLTALVTNLHTLLAAGALDQPMVFGALALGEFLMMTLLIGSTALVFNAALLQPGQKLEDTLYLITNRRVLIQRGREELHLDRSRIIDVIDAPTMSGLRDVFLVLDGPQARALEVGGAFNETDRDPHLKPILELVADAELVAELLGRTSRPSGTGKDLAA